MEGLCGPRGKMHLFGGDGVRFLPIPAEGIGVQQREEVS